MGQCLLRNLDTRLRLHEPLRHVPPPVYQGAALPLAIRGSPALSSDLSYGAVTTRFNTYSVNTSTNIRVGVMMPGGPAGRQFTVQRAEVSTLG